MNTDVSNADKGLLPTPPFPGELPAVSLTENASQVLVRRYVRRGEDGKPVESVAEMFWRVAYHVAKVEEEFGADVNARAREFFDLLSSKRFFPNSPTFTGAGTALGQLAACFVLPITDDMGRDPAGIFQSLRDAALIQQTGGGNGFSFSRLRPKGSLVKTSAGQATGPVGFLRVYDHAFGEIAQGGTRRGANMAVLRYDHPDILEFVDCKLADVDAITNFNLSVGVDEEFMLRVRADDSIDLVNPRSGDTVGAIRAKELFERIVSAAWQCGDPGLVFLDRINEPRTNPTPKLGRIEATNPCGEQPLLPFEACTLGSVNLERFVTEAGEVDWVNLRRVVHTAVRFLDDVVEVSRYPVPQIGAMTRDGNRKIGLGVMGWADLLIRLGVPYDSDAALRIAADVSQYVQAEADAASEALADERGCFPNWEHSYYGGIDRPMRNATRTTIAPTGTISIIAGCSSGIEPLYALSMHRKVLDGELLDEVQPLLQDALAARGLAGSSVEAAVAASGRLRGVEGVPDDLARLFATAHEVDLEWHVRMQATFQHSVDCAVSKTVNLPSSATASDVERVYTLAYELGCKGVTVFRDTSRGPQVLHAGRAEQEKEAARVAPVPVAADPAVVLPRPVPDEGDGLPSRRFRVPTPLGTMNVFVTELDGRPFEVFVVFGKAGSDLTAMSEAIGRLASLALRSRIPVSYVAEQLRGIGGRSSIGFGEQRVLSVVDALAKLLEANYMTPQAAPGTVDAEDGRPDVQGAADPVAPLFEGQVLEICPECQEYAFEYAEGCGKCHACGYTTC